MSWRDDLKSMLTYVKQQLKADWDVGAEKGKALKKAHNKKLESLKDGKKR